MTWYDVCAGCGHKEGQHGRVGLSSLRVRVVGCLVCDCRQFELAPNPSSGRSADSSPERGASPSPRSGSCCSDEEAA